MLKREITYQDFNGDTVTDTFYFNLTRTELVELEVSYDGGLEGALKRITETQNAKEIIAEFKKIVLLAYGERSSDGKRFIKNNEIREEFSQTAAYDALFMELATDDGAAATFIQGIMPVEFRNVETVQLPQPPIPPTES